MDTMIFVNLPVSDLPRATAFYTGLGFAQNPQFSDDNASSIVISDTIVVMLLRTEFFGTFTKKPIADAHAQAEAILGLSAESREAVDALAAKAVANGGSEPNPPTDHGFMYSRQFEDPDGHIWEVIFMDMAAMGS